MNERPHANEKQKTPDNKPYAMLGAGRLTAALWKTGDCESGWRYHFNIFGMDPSSGHVTQRFSPHDVADLARLTQILAFAITDDGCLETDLRDDLSCLSACLDDVLPRRESPVECPQCAACSQTRG